MDKETANIIVIACLLLNLVGIALLSTSLGTRYWVESDSLDFHIGLFRFCTQDVCHDTDHLNDIIYDPIKEVRGLCITAMVCYVIAKYAFLFVAVRRYTLSSKAPGIISLIASIVGGMHAIGAVVHFVREYEDLDVSKSHTDYGYSLHLAWASALPAMLAGVLFLSVIKFFFVNGQTTGQVIHGLQPPYLQPATDLSQPMAHNNSFMMSNMNPSVHGQSQQNPAPISSINSPGSLYSGVPQNHLAGSSVTRLPMSSPGSVYRSSGTSEAQYHYAGSSVTGVPKSSPGSVYSSSRSSVPHYHYAGSSISSKMYK